MALKNPIRKEWRGVKWRVCDGCWRCDCGSGCERVVLRVEVGVGAGTGGSLGAGVNVVSLARTAASVNAVDLTEETRSTYSNLFLFHSWCA